MGETERIKCDGAFRRQLPPPPLQDVTHRGDNVFYGSHYEKNGTPEQVLQVVLWHAHWRFHHLFVDRKQGVFTVGPCFGIRPSDLTTRWKPEAGNSHKPTKPHKSEFPTIHPTLLSCGPMRSTERGSRNDSEWTASPEAGPRSQPLSLVFIYPLFFMVTVKL